MNFDLEHLRALMRRLRDPQRGCPWDLEQDFRSIVPHTLEEAYEVAHAIESDALDALPAELGDLLFQVVFYAQLGEEQQRFSFDDVIAAICAKLIARHPHVFANEQGGSAADVAQAWEARKAAERRARNQSSELDDVPVALPALTRAQKIQKRAARVGFDWPDASGARAKLDEEIEEFDQATSVSKAAMSDELGDILFTLVNLARHRGIDPERALRAATAKFEQRFRAVEKRAAEAATPLESMTASELDRLWRAVKSTEKKKGA